MTHELQKLTGPRAWTLNARVQRTWQEARFPDCLPVNDWRRRRAIVEGSVVENLAAAKRWRNN